MKRLGLVLLLTLIGTGARGQALFDEIALSGSLTPGEALQRLAEQTGVRFAGASALANRDKRELSFRGGLRSALRGLGAECGLAVSRIGLYDFLVAPLAQPERVQPTCPVGQLAVRVLGVHQPVETAARAADSLAVELAIDAPDELTAARVQRLDPESLRLLDDAGREHRLLADRYRAPDWQRQRMGTVVSLPFDPPAPTCRTVELRGELICYQQVDAVQFELDPATAGTADAVRGPVRLALVSQQPGRERWRADLRLTRGVLLGDEQPWVDAALRGTDGRLRRPLDLQLSPGELPADEDQVATLCHLTFPLPEGVQPGRLYFQVAQRLRPWDRVGFHLAGLALPTGRHRP